MSVLTAQNSGQTSYRRETVMYVQPEGKKKTAWEEDRQVFRR